MSYISGRGDVTSGVADGQPVDLQIEGRQGRAADGGGRGRVVPDLYPSRRSLGQRLIDTTLAWLAALAFLGPVLVQRRQDRKAGTR